MHSALYVSVNWHFISNKFDWLKNFELPIFNIVSSIVSKITTCCFVVFGRLQAVGTALTDSAHESISGQKQSAKVEPGLIASSLELVVCLILLVNTMLFY